MFSGDQFSHKRMWLLHLFNIRQVKNKSFENVDFKILTEFQIFVFVQNYLTFRHSLGFQTVRDSHIPLVEYFLLLTKIETAG